MGDAAGRRAVVTGAASGIGFAVVRRLLGEGAEVLAVDINAEGMAPLAAAGAETLVASVADEGDRDRIADGRRRSSTTSSTRPARCSSSRSGR